MIRMRRVGEVLRDERQKKRYTIHFVSQQTKLKESYVEAIEAGDYSALPLSTFTKGLIANYAKFLGLNPQEILAIYRREFNETQERIGPAPRLENRRLFSITPSTVVRVVTALIILILLGYFIREYRILTGPPPLRVTSPRQDMVITQGTVDVSGSTTAEATVTVNDQDVTVDTNGNFHVSIDLPANVTNGDNQVMHIIVSAQAKSGKTSTIDRTIIVK